MLYYDSSLKTAVTLSPVEICATDQFITALWILYWHKNTRRLLSQISCFMQ